MPQPKQGTHTNVTAAHEDAIAAAAKFLLIRVKLDKEVVKVGEAARLSVEFYDSPSGERKLVLADPTDSHPVVVALDDVEPNENELIEVTRQDVGRYNCCLVPKRAGQREYLVKESQKTDRGQLVELEVLDAEDYRKAEVLWREWANKYRDWLNKDRWRS
jgi:hypothetical protein